MNQRLINLYKPFATLRVSVAATAQHDIFLEFEQKYNLNLA